MLPKARTSKNGKCACAARCWTTAVLDRLSGQDRLILTAYSGRSLAVSWQQARAMSEHLFNNDRQIAVISKTCPGACIGLRVHPCVHWLMCTSVRACMKIKKADDHKSCMMHR